MDWRTSDVLHEEGRKVSYTYFPSKQRTFSDGRNGKIVWRVVPYIADAEAERVLQEYYDNGFTAREIFRNPPNSSGLETTTFFFSKKEYAS